LFRFDSSILVLQIQVRGIAYGGISEVDESNYYSCNMGASFSREIGKYGFKPTIMEEMLAGKHVYGPTVGLGYYTRGFDGVCSPSDLETALQVKPLAFRFLYQKCTCCIMFFY